MRTDHGRSPITCLTLSVPSSLLLVGTWTGLISIYDTISHQQLRTISSHKGFIITHLTTILKPPDLIGHINLNLNVGSGIDMKDVLPVRTVTPFQRMRDPKTRDKHEVEMILPIQDNVRRSFSLNLQKI
jgi:pre-rRNA-processing protein IPI3